MCLKISITYVGVTCISSFFEIQPLGGGGVKGGSKDKKNKGFFSN